MKVEPERSKKTLDEIMARQPGVVWPHLDLVELESLPGRRDPGPIESHLKAFLRVCPECPDAYRHFEFVQDPELIRQGARNLRRSFERRNTPLDLPGWPILWALEGRSGLDPAELRSRVRGDLKRIESWPFRPLPEFLAVYRHASELLSDSALLEALDAKVAKSAPHSRLMLSIVQARWSRENPRPGRDAPPEEQKRHREKESQAEAEWRRGWPGDCGFVQNDWMRIASMARGDNRANVEEVISAADKILRCREEFPDAGVSWPPVQTGLAELYVKYGVRLEEVPKLLDAGLEAVEKQEKYRITLELIPAELRATAIDNRELTFQRTQQIRADYLIASDRLGEARAVIEQELARIEANRPRSNGPPHDQARFRLQPSEWLQRLARVAEKENRVEDALALYRSSLKGLPKQALASAILPPVASVKQCYLNHGGTERGWLEWATAAAGPEPPRLTPAPVRFEIPLPDFSITDLGQWTWTLQGLKGKGTFVNLWATWCGPCLAEHPEIQRLHELAKEHPNLQVLTVSVDANPMLVTTYLKKKNYTFPVIHAPVLAAKLFPWVGLPTSFLVNGHGWRSGLYPFAAGEQSVQRTLADLIEAATARSRE